MKLMARSVITKGMEVDHIMGTVRNVAGAGVSLYPSFLAASLSWNMGFGSPMALANSLIFPRSTSQTTGAYSFPIFE